MSNTVANAASGGRIYRTQDGQQWEPVIQKGFDSPHALQITSLTEFQGDLYATADDPADDCAKIFRSHTGSAFDSDWVQLPEVGWDSGSSAARGVQAVFNGSTWTEAIVNAIAGSDQGQLFRTQDGGSSWEDISSKVGFPSSGYTGAIINLTLDASGNLYM